MGLNRPELYAHHDRRLNALVEQSEALYSSLYNKENGFRNDSPEAEPLKQRVWRLHRLIGKASVLRDRYASNYRWTPYQSFFA